MRSKVLVAVLHKPAKGRTQDSLSSCAEFQRMAARKELCDTAEGCQKAMHAT